MTLFKGSHHFSSTLAVFDDTLYRQPSLQQNFSSLWWRSLKTLCEDRHHFSRTLAGFDDTLSRQPSLQQSLMTVLFSKEPFAAAFGKNKKLLSFCWLNVSQSASSLDIIVPLAPWPGLMSPKNSRIGSDLVEGLIEVTVRGVGLIKQSTVYTTCEYRYVLLRYIAEWQYVEYLLCDLPPFAGLAYSTFYTECK